MKKRSKEILDLLGRRENDHTISTLAAKFEVSERTIRNDIKDINDYLKEQEIKPIRFGSNGLIVMEEDISQARETTQQEDFYTYKLSKEERRMLAAAILINTKDHITLSQIADILYVSLSLIHIYGKPKRFLEQENYYNVINGYKDLFLLKDTHGKPVEPETYLSNAHFNELKTLFLFDRELRFLFLKYLLIFENSFKTVISHEFSRKYPKANSYLDIANYREDDPKGVLKQISILTKTIHDNVGAKGAIKHYIEDHGSVPLWVLVNYLTIGNLSYLYGALKDSEKKMCIRDRVKTAL